MSHSTAVAACAIGAAALLLVGSTAFTAGFRTTSSPASAGHVQLMGRIPVIEADMGSSTASLSIGLVAGLATAALAAVNRGLVSRKAEGLATATTDSKIAMPLGTSQWVEENQIDGSFTAGPSLGPIAVWNQGAVFGGGLVGSEYHGWGEYQFDPMGLANRYPEHLPWYREAELKHGRVAMLACIGLIAPDGFRLPFNACAGDDLDMFTAHNKLIGPGLGEGPMWWLLLFCGTIESIRFKQLGLGFGDLSLENAGDMNFGKGFLPATKEGQVQMKIKELKNGRLAMLAFSGAITQGILWEQHHFPFVPM